MAYEFATYEKQGRIAIVTLNRPERMNALHPLAHFELHEIWNDFERDPELWVGILTGAGDKAFSAGNDLRFTAEHGRDMVRMAESGFGGLASRTTCAKPILAAVNGYALGGGFEMALACDIIVAADHARLGHPLDIALRLNYPAAEAMRRSEDTVEGPRAFAEKRKPNWKAR